jgi:uncharacterized protein YjbJ (UPF0337 family)
MNGTSHSVSLLQVESLDPPVAAWDTVSNNQRRQREVHRMEGGKSDRVKGRVKEAAGVLTGDKKLEREGKADQSAGKLKEGVEKIKKKAKKAIDEAKNAVS